MSAQPALLVLTGASGAGKTTLLHELEALGLPGVGCYGFDSIGIPTEEEMVAGWGSAEAWQRAATDAWIERLLRNEAEHEVAVLDGQMRPSDVRELFERFGVRIGRVVLVNCDHDERNERLRGPRGQPELACARMDCWAAYLRGQADALGLPIIDSSRPIARSVADLSAQIDELAELRRPA
jgi:energy-coupling factor transporter ATP-binding protein EcfA2